MNRQWSDIAGFYGETKAPYGTAMHALVLAIKGSRYAAELFPWTSMMDLCIAQTPVNYPYNGPYMRISPISSETLEFRYLDSWDEKKQWRRTVPMEKAFLRLERFFDELHWFLPATGLA